MIRLGIVVEGATEEAFVQSILGPHLRDFQVDAKASSLGGRVSLSRIVNEMVKFSHSFDAVTSLIDFYGFQDRPDAAADDLQARIDGELARRVKPGARVFSYVQMHEFEALLFADVSGFAVIAGAPANLVVRLRSIRAQFPTPEEINDSPATAPSKRIRGEHPGYKKVAGGRAVAEEIGLAGIRAECPRFDAWVARLEALGEAG